jgi:NADPH2:quinone reductase
LDAAEAVSLVLNYITAYQMLHRSAKVRPGQRALIHGAAGGVGSAVLQLGRLAGLEMYGTCSSRGASVVSDLGGIPIDYQHQDFVKETRRLTSEGVDVVFDGMGGTHMWRSRKALRPGGRVVAYGLTSSLHGGRLAPGRRHRYRGIAIFGLYIAGSWLLPGRKRVVPYSIQWLKRLRPALFRQDLIALLDLLKQQKIKPLIARRPGRKRVVPYSILSKQCRSQPFRKERRLVLDEIEEVLRRDSEERCIRFVLCNLDGKNRRAVHPAESLQIAPVIENRNV